MCHVWRGMTWGQHGTFLTDMTTRAIITMTSWYPDTRQFIKTIATTSHSHHMHHWAWRETRRPGDGHLGESFPIFKSLNAIHIVFYLKTCMKWISLKNKNAQTVIILNQESKCMSLDGCDLMTNYSVQCLISRVLAGIKLPGAPESWLFSWQRHDLWRHWAPRHWGLGRQTHLAATTISKH